MASSALDNGEDDESMASPTLYNGEDAETKASPTLNGGEDGESKASPPLYGAGDDLLFGVHSVLCFAVFSSQKVRVTVAIDRIDGIGDTISGAEDVWCGLKALFVIKNER